MMRNRVYQAFAVVAILGVSSWASGPAQAGTTINTPDKDEQITAGETILVTGFVDAAFVRIALLKGTGNDEVDYVIVPVSMGNFTTANLSAPLKAFDVSPGQTKPASITVKGFDSLGAFIPGSTRTVNFTVTGPAGD